MAISRKTWPLTSYTNNTWTNLVAEVADVDTLIASNTSLSTAITINVRVQGAEFGGSIVLAAGEAKPLRAGTLRVGSGSAALQVKASAAGIHFVAAGDVEG